MPVRYARVTANRAFNELRNKADKNEQVDSANAAWNPDSVSDNFAVKNVETLKYVEKFKLILTEILFINSVGFHYYNQLFL